MTKNCLVTFPDLHPRFGLSYSRDHIRRLVKRGAFPAPKVKLSSRLNAWSARDIRAWIASKAA